MYDRRNEGQTLTFDFGEGLVKDNLLVVDRETSSIWSQLHGKSISGPMKGKPWKVVPALQTTWQYWKGEHPTTKVVQISGAQARPYRYRSSSTARGTTDHDTSELGLGLVVGDESLFASLDGLASLDGPQTMTLGGQTITLHNKPQALTAWAVDSQGELMAGVLAYRAGWMDFYPEARWLANDEPVLEVRALANEGFLLSVGRDVVAIDAFVAEPYAGYGALSGEPLAALESGSGPFASLDLALTSHVHQDHFQPAPARKLMAACVDCLFVSTPQVVQSLLNRSMEGVDPARVRSYFAVPGESRWLEQGQIQVEFIQLSHGTGRFASIENLGHLITIRGVTALHVGDAAMVPRNFALYDLPKKGIDVAFVPYWYFDDEVGQQIIREHFLPAKLVACHIPPSKLVALKLSMSKSHPEVIVPVDVFELFRFTDEN